MLMFWSTPIEAMKLQEALDIIKQYNEFDSKKVGKALLKTYPKSQFIVGREYSVVVYVLTDGMVSAEEMKSCQSEMIADEGHVTSMGIRYWWD
jgi:hypothetical protein